MSQYGEPWLWGFWVPYRRPDRTEWYVFREKLDDPLYSHCQPELWGSVKYGDEIRCRDWNKGKYPHKRIVYQSTDYYGGAEYDDDVLGRGVVCVNACRCIPTEVVGEVLDRLFTAMMLMEGCDGSSEFAWSAELAGEDLRKAAGLLKGAGVDLTELLKQCRLEKPNV